MSQLIHGYATRRKLATAQRQVKDAYRIIAHLEFIVKQAPFLQIPEGADCLARLRKSAIPYAYINPISWLKLMDAPLDLRHLKPFYQLRENATKFVMCARLPEGVIIFTPNKMPEVDGL